MDMSFDDAELLRSIGRNRKDKTLLAQQHQQPKTRTSQPPARPYQPQASTLAARSHHQQHARTAPRAPDWGPPIPSAAAAKHDEYGLFNTSPGVGRAGRSSSARPPINSPFRRHAVPTTTAARSPHAPHPLQQRLVPSSPPASSSASASSSSSDEMESPFRPLPMQSRESTGNHRALAASSTMGGWTRQQQQQQQQKQRQAKARSSAMLGPEALRKLDRFAAATSASESESSSNRKVSGGKAERASAPTKDSCEPTYVYPSRDHLPSSPSPAPTGRHTGRMNTFVNQLRTELQAVDTNNASAQAQTSKSNHDSSAETLVDAPIDTAGKHAHAEHMPFAGMNAGGYAKILPFRTHEDQQHHGQLLLPTGVEMGKGPQRGSLFLPDDVTGLTDALESPQKTRLGVKHASLHPNIGKLDLDERVNKIAELRAFITGIEDELNTTKDRLDGVESREEELRSDMRRLRDEWAQPVPQKHQEKQHPVQAEEDVWTGRLMPIVEHVAALHAAFDGYRQAFDEIQGREGHTKQDKAQQTVQQPDKQARQERRTVRPHPEHVHYEEETEDAHAASDVDDDEYSPVYSQLKAELKADIRRLEKQLMRMESIVERTRSQAGQGQETEADTEADVPPRRPSSSLRRVRMASASGSAPTHRASEPPFGRRKASAKYQQQDTARDERRRASATAEPRSDELDETVVLDYDLPSSTMPVTASTTRKSSDSRRARVESDGGENEDAGAGLQDELTMADARVNRTLRNVMKGRVRGGSGQGEGKNAGDASLSAELSHDAARCTVCVSAEERSHRRATRRARVMASVKRHDQPVTGGVEEDLILSVLTSADPTNLQSVLSQVTSSSSHSTLTSLLRKMLQQHMDEFYHARLLYSELADELKGMDPLQVTKAKRKILVDHVLERVEELEVRAERIDTVKGVLDVVVLQGKEKDTLQPATLGRALANSPPCVDPPPARKTKNRR